ncbi:DNA internalization-related competence protein ComEC/Rec2 [Paraburkholderia sp. CNPSo 3076]|uniref:DNA internalization-related competence protein ComEC/Rec2 n=1 Tax=Paraburkholderia sp. CNPSo 3076 TaxID=2940936 RepID=UPI00224F148B|nr:DNA internalization-related competence protein ComEC/Rec2 [Paraburkholderia sp. CNPSo 3076]MCX5538511.1 DNA internalization-related competence protein ComEC/Rec2 [Paraburkholderia sp. CNPSo 3076]
MRAIGCGFALGVIALQRQAALPGAGAWVWLVLATVLAAGWAAWALGAAQPADESHEASRRVFGLSCWRRWRIASGWAAVWFAAGCAGFGYAAWRAEARLAEALPAAWQARDIGITGYISSLPSYGANGVSFLFRVESWETHKAATPLPHLIQLSWVAREAPLPPLVPGARWRLAVRLKRPHGNGNFGLRDAEAALLARGVRANGYVSDPQHAVRLPVDATGIGVRIERARAALRARVDAVLGDAPHRGIVVALAIGAQDAISDADRRLMRNTGTSHLVAISGLHLAFVAGLAGWGAGALWRRARWCGVEAPLIVPAQKVAVAGALLAAGVYAALAGFNVPVQRALWMLAVVALALFAGREVARSHVLAWALGLVLLRDPWAVTAAGFWLSFCAVGAILFAASGVPRLHTDAPQDSAADAADPMRDRTEPLAGPTARDGWLRRLAAMIFPAGGWRGAIRRLASRLGDSARVQWAVTLALAPLTAYWFAQIPLVGPLANALAIPWVSMLVTPLVIASAALPAPIDALALRVAHTCLDWLVVALSAMESLPWAVLRLPQPGVWPLACAALGVVWWLAPRGWPLRWIAPFTWLPLLVPAPTGPQPGAFRLTALDIGQGTSVLVETARHRLLFDAGPGPESTQAGERIVVPYLQAHGIGRLDALMISHDDSDHSGGAQAVLDAVDVGTFVAGILPAHPLWASARTKSAQIVQCAAGQRWQWDGVDFEVLWPDPGPLAGKPNAHCCVLRVTTAASAVSDAQDGPISALLAADIEAGDERTLVARDPVRLRSQVLVVPHHGSRSSSTEPFLDSVWPLVAIFQVGYLNRFHHPHPGVYARYAARHIVLARSDADGAARVEARPGALAVERFRDTQRRYWMDLPTQD